MSLFRTLCLAAIASCGLAAEVATPSCIGPSCDASSGDEAGLLQQRARRTLAAESTAEVGSLKAIAYEGGGFLAQFAYTGLLVGLGAAARPEEPVESLLEGADILSSTSGGTWLSMSLVFSEAYLKWVNDLKSAAGGPGTDEIPRLYNDYYVERLNAVLPLCSYLGTSSYIARLVAKMVAFGYLQSEVAKMFQLPLAMAEIGFNASTTTEAGISSLSLRQLCQLFDYDWDYSSDRLLAGTADLAPEDTLGNKNFNEWARGKIFQATVSIPARTNADTSWYPKSADNYVRYNGPISSAVMYEPSGEHPQNIPGKISWKLGSSGRASPRSFCGDAACGNVSLKYTGGRWNPTYEVPMAPVWDDIYHAKARDLPLTRIAAASSASDGRSGVARSRKQGPLSVTGEAPVWAARGGEQEDAFAAGKGVQEMFPWTRVSKQTKVASQNALHPLADGGDTDLTGMAQAIASGADHVVSLQIAHAAGNLPDSFDMFDKGGRFGSGRIFEDSTTSEDMFKAYNESEHVLPSSSATLDKVVWFERTLTTKHNPWFGIEAGRKVTVVFVFVSPTSAVGLAPPFNTFQEYGLFIRDIAATLQGDVTFAKELAAKFPAK